MYAALVIEKRSCQEMFCNSASVPGLNYLKGKLQVFSLLFCNKTNKQTNTHRQTDRSSFHCITTFLTQNTVEQTSSVQICTGTNFFCSDLYQTVTFVCLMKEFHVFLGFVFFFNPSDSLSVFHSVFT